MHDALPINRVDVSIFVNPSQFGPNEDFSRYPRQEAADAALLTDAKCDVLWLPDVATMYPQGFATTVSVAGVSEGLCGAARPGHFDGVATAVLQLFHPAMPHDRQGTPLNPSHYYAPTLPPSAS